MGVVRFSDIKPYSALLLISTGVVALLSLVLLNFVERKPLPIAVTMSVSKTPLSAPIYIAYYFKLFEQCGVDINLSNVIGGKRSFAQLTDGTVDFATSSDSVVAFSAFNHSDFKVLFSFASSDNDVKVIYRNEVDLRDDSQLKVGYYPATASEYLLQLYQGLGNIANDAELVKLSPEHLLTALQSSGIDAMVNWEPYAWMAINEGGGNFSVAETKNLYSLHFDLVAATQFIESNPDVVTRIGAALILATHVMQRSPEEAKQLLVDHLQLSPDFVDWVWEDYLFSVGAATNITDSYTANARWFLDEGLVSGSSVPRFDDFVFNIEDDLFVMTERQLLKRCNF